MRILHIVSSMNPRGGGPSEGIRQLAPILKALGHFSECLCADDPTSSWLSKQPLPVHAVGPGRLGTYNYCPRIKTWLMEHASNYDAFVVNGLWQHHSFAARSGLRAVGREYVIFCHGMLDPWFATHYPLKHLKKWLYWPWGEYRNLRDAKYVLFTCEEERLQAKKSFWLYSAKEKVVSYGTSTPPQDGDRLKTRFLETFPQLKASRLILFLGRIHEKKGCDLLLSAFQSQVDRGNLANTILVMAGPDPDGLGEDLMRAHPALVKSVAWLGMLQGEDKWGAFYASDAFILPSHQENFGIAVAEALGCGIPVLISDKVNIWREIEGDGAGIVAPDTIAGTEALLQRWVSSSELIKSRMRVAAMISFANRFTAEAAATSLLGVLNDRE